MASSVISNCIFYVLIFLPLVFSVSLSTHAVISGVSAGEGSSIFISNHGSIQALNGTGYQRNARRLLIGSAAPVCSYNECRGCKGRCRAEEVPVDTNDPINSAYRYKCLCQRL